MQEKINALEKLAGGSNNGKATYKTGRRAGTVSKSAAKAKGGKKADSNEYAVELVKYSGREWKIRELNTRLQQDGYRKSAKAALKAGGLRISSEDP